VSIIVNSLDELPLVCDALLKRLADEKVVAFYGEMGVGKTTFIRQFIEYLGGGETDSPTFSLVNECELNTGEVVYHFDFYRIESEEEAMDMGIEEYLYSGNLCLIEWPKKIENLLPEKFVNVFIEEVDGKRIFKID
jgi:tRNA threonylcarbamoyladenosine biosynthesis protein TsaE